MRATSSNKYGRILKFLISGGGAASTEYASFIILHTFFGVNLVAANIISFFCGLVVSFLLNKYWVFKSSKSTYSGLLRYISLALINVLLSTALVYLFVDVAGIGALVAKITVMAIIASWNYVIFSRLIFKT